MMGGGGYRVTITVTRVPGTQNIGGIVRDIVTLDGEFVEDAIDW